MAIDPITATGGAAAKLPTDTDVSAGSSATSHDGAQNAGQSSDASASLGSSNSVDIVDFASQQNSQTLPLDALSADGKARHFANPTTLGEEVLNYLQGFHKRVGGYEPLSVQLASSEQTADSASMSTGPASMVPTSQEASLGSAGTNQTSSDEARFELIFDIMRESGFRHTETNLVSGVGQQFSRSMGTLMRGQ